MKFAQALFGLTLIVVSACSQVVIDPEVRSSDPVPPLTAAAPNPRKKPKPALVVLPRIQPVLETGFAAYPSGAYTVQIAAVKSLDMIDQIEARHSQLSGAMRVPTRDPELGDLHAVLIGVFRTEQAAKAMALSLPPMVAGDEPWIRTVASVRAVMR